MARERARTEAAHSPDGKFRWRADLSFNAGDGSYSWQFSGPQYADRMPGGGAVSAGILRFEAGKVVLETNSAERYRKARTWLDKIPGFAFSHVEAKPGSALAWLDEWLKLGEEAGRNAPPGPSAREILEQDRARLDHR